MSRYIDTDLAKEALTGWETDPTDEEIILTIDRIPTAAVVSKSELEQLQEVNADLNESLRLAAEANKDLDAKAENLAYKLGCLLCHATGGRLSNHTYDLLTMEKVVTDYLDETYREGKEEGYKNVRAEVAAEIFEEIEKIGIVTRVTMRGEVIHNVSAEYTALKNKYTGGKNQCGNTQ